MDIEYLDFIRRESFSSIRVDNINKIYWSSLSTVGGREWSKGGGLGFIVMLPSLKKHFISAESLTYYVLIVVS